MEKNHNVVLRNMGQKFLDSCKHPKQVRANGQAIQQGFTVIQGAWLTADAKKHDKTHVNEIFDRSTLIPKENPKKELTKAARTLGKHSHKRSK